MDIEATSDNFNFGIHISVSTFEKDLRNMLHFYLLQNPEEFPSWSEEDRTKFLSAEDGGGIVTVHNVSVTAFNLTGIAYGQDPHFE